MKRTGERVVGRKYIIQYKLCNYKSRNIPSNIRAIWRFRESASNGIHFHCTLHTREHVCIFTLGSGGLKGFLFDDVSRAIVKCIKMRMSEGGHAFLQYRFEVRRKRKLLSATERILECTRCHDIHISSLPFLSLTITKRYRALSYFPQLTFPINSRKIRTCNS